MKHITLIASVLFLVFILKIETASAFDPSGGCFNMAAAMCGVVEKEELSPESAKIFENLTKKLVVEMEEVNKFLKKSNEAGAQKKRWKRVRNSGKRTLRNVRKANRRIRKNKDVVPELTPIRRKMKRDEFFEVIDANIEISQQYAQDFKACLAEFEAGTLCDCETREQPASLEFRTAIHGVNGSSCSAVAFVAWDSSITEGTTSVTAKYDLVSGSNLLPRTETATAPFDNSFAVGSDGVAIEASGGRNWIAIGSNGTANLSGEPIAECDFLIEGLQKAVKNPSIEYEACP